MPKIRGAYDCTYCHGNTDDSCTACDSECNAIEIANGDEEN